jgi:hypothetical protein
MCSAKRYVRFTPESGHWQCTSPCPLCAKSGHDKILFYHHIGSSEQRRRYCEPKRFGGFQVHDQLIFCRSLYREFGRFLTFKNAIDVARRAAVLVGFIGSIGCEATGSDKRTLEVDRRQLMSCRQSYDEVAMALR